MRLDNIVTQLLYDGYRWILKHGDRLMDIVHYVYYSAGLSIPHDTALYQVYQSMIRSSVQVVTGAPMEWTPLLSEIDFKSKSR